MTDPIRIPCRTEAEIPPPERLGELVSRERHLVLQFPHLADGSSPLADKGLLIRETGAGLPNEEFTVFDSGGTSDDEGPRFGTA